MFFTTIAAAAAWTMAPGELPDLGRWNEVALPAAPFRIDMPMPWKTVEEADESGSKVKTWKTAYGLMSIRVEFMDRPGRAGFTARQHLEMLAGGLMRQWKNPSAKVTDLTILGYPAAKLEMENDVDSGRIHTERLLIRVGDDDWTVQTSRFVTDGAVDSMHIFRSIKPLAPPPVLTPATIGRLTIKGFGKPAVSGQQLSPAEAQLYASSTVYAFDYQGTTKAWIYHLRLKPGAAFDARALAQVQIDNVKGQSQPNAVAFSFPNTFGGYPGMLGRGQAITGEGEECFRIVTVGDGADGWVMLMAGPNSARTETILRDMIASIQIAPQLPG